MSGDFFVRGAGLCTLARWPAESCQVGADDAEQGARVRELLQHLQQTPSWNVPELHWADGTTTQLNVEGVSTPSTACVELSVDANGQRRPFDSVRAPVQLHVSTADARIDAVFPGEVAALVSSGGRWSRLSFVSREEVSSAPGGFGHFALAGLDPGARAVVYLSGERDQGFLSVSALAPISSALRDIINAGCSNAPTSANGRAQAGRITDVSTARWGL